MFDAPAGISARFDDLTPGGTSLSLAGPVDELVADRTDQVVGVLRAAEERARRGRWVAGFVAYEAAPAFDPSFTTTLRHPQHPLSKLPLAWFGVFEDRVEAPPLDPPAEAAAGDWVLGAGPAWHRGAVDRIRRLIADGETYQVNLTARVSGSVPDPEALYAALARAQAGAHNALIVTPSHAVVSASPELFFALDGDRVVTRPMKGTARRGRWPAEDAGRRAGLLASEKDRAENVMIVDLLRNDLGRIARFGDVEVDDLCRAERYPTVWQLTSTIRARLRPAVALADVFGALFPSGSVTGAPKSSTMRAIAELEDQPRGVYCGAIGYLAPGPERRAVFSVAIRTATVDLQSGAAEYGAGGGITWSSDPTAEWDELVAKTAILDRPPAPSALLETMRFDPSEGVRNLDRHLQRLAGSADYFGFRFDRREALTAIARAVDAEPVPRRLRLTLSPTGGLNVTLSPCPPDAARPVTLGLAPTPVRSDDLLLFHKHADRTRYDDLRAERPDVDDVLLWNERREATETTIANLLVRLGDTWWTPPLTCGLLPGVGRARLLDEGAVRERVMTIDDVRAADELALVNSLRGVRAAVLS